MDLQHLIQTVWGIGFMKLKNVGQWLIGRAWDSLRYIMMIFLELKMHFKEILERLWELQTLRNVRHTQQEEMLYWKLEIFPYRMTFLGQLVPEDYPLQLDYAENIRPELNNDSG